MFKKSYVRGITSALVQTGHAAFPSEELAAKVADHIADNIGELNFDQPVAPADTAKIANHVIDASNAFKERGQQSGAFAKMASMDDLAKHAHAHAIDLMEKAAEGSNYVGGDKGNAEAFTAEGKADEKDRPEGYAANARGQILNDVPPTAQVGHEQTQPAEQHNSPSGTNSLTDASKSAALGELMKKIAIPVAGSAAKGDPHFSAEAKAESTDRPEGYARLPHQGALGSLMKAVGGDATVGKEMANPQAQSNHPAGSNSLIETSKKADADPFIALFKKTAQEVAPHLPGGLSDDQKVAHIRSVMGLTTEEKAHYLVGLQKRAAEKVSGEIPPQFLAHMKGKDGEKDEKKDGEKDEKKDEKKDEDKDKHDLPDFMKKKEGAAADTDLAARLRAITQSVDAK